MDAKLCTKKKKNSVPKLSVPPLLLEAISVAVESVGGCGCQLGNKGILLLLLLLIPCCASAACQVRREYYPSYSQT
ncbi:hypothetical protein E2C01_001208 [Portunus trituberculatus]|uniref:Uncharacterized protein n=1 Tax=Portunus trituberculatus TaxID=210409 RepID=A0A5B7CH26_PORTR|nr:hypothetical protein [Portunus trituberculatus]